jgi:hypothetical protein
MRNAIHLPNASKELPSDELDSRQRRIASNLYLPRPSWDMMRFWKKRCRTC